MATLHSGGAHWIEPPRANPSRANIVPLVQVSADVYDFVVGGVAALELVDQVGAGEYTTVAVGTAPASPRLRALLLGTGSDIIVTP